MFQEYKPQNFRPQSLAQIEVINGIVDEYEAQGYMLTTRQVYYQLVARGEIENTLQSYKRVASTINDGKMAGLIDWDMIEDRTREVITRSHWSSPGQILRAVGQQYHQDLWLGQRNRVFVFIEKEALVGVLETLCHTYDVPLLACRGYPSGSVLRSFARDHVMPAISDGIDVTILHLGDHDPSGIDMSRDLEERIKLFAEVDDYSFGQDSFGGVEFRRLALNMDQIHAQKPPENPAKSTDSRYKDYRKKFGNSSWELDALQPKFLNQLVEDELTDLIDDDVWQEQVDEINEHKKAITQVATDFDNKDN